ncbi:Rne/Rng family ribonuclease [Georgenia sp. TF02-10]|uniref:Rne/Rng family ribonuclease n=1 Tax=Georgenia sp. TF02-10 TaxID=2917725 RepID=UPI00352CBB7E
MPADQPASAETGDQAPPADQAAPADAGDQAASADGVGQAPPAPTTDQAAPDQAAGSTAGPDTAGPTRPARRSRRATSAPRTPEQRLDVLAELGLAQPSAAPTPPTSVDDAEEEAEATAAQDDTATGAAPVDTGDDDAAVATPPADTTAATDPDAATAASPAATLDEEGEGPRLPAAALLFQAPDLSQARPRRRRATAPAGAPAADARAEAPTTEAPTEAPAPGGEPADQAEPAGTEAEDTGEEQTAARRRRRRGGRGRRNRSAEDETTAEATGAEPADKAETEPAHAQAVVTEPASAPAGGAEPVTEREPAEQDDGEEGGGSRRRRRRRRSGRSETEGARSLSDEVTALKGSTRLEAKRQRRREGREAGRRRPTISEAEFLARRESVTRTMVVREKEGLNQIAVLEDNILVEHYVARHTQSSMVGNVYLGRVQNVLPSMEAAFVDLGKGRNAVLYAGEVNWDAAGLEGQPRRIEQALKSGDTVLVQVTKDPIGHKGARLTSQITLAGRHLVLVPSGAMTGISRKLPDTERARLKKLLKEIVPDGAGVIVRTAAEGASEEQLRADVDRLVRQWADIEAKAKAAKSAPVLLRGEPELAVRVVRDVFNEDFESLVVAGDTAWETISAYVADLSPDLADRLHHWTAEQDVFAAYRVDEQLAKAMDRKVWLPSGGSLVIDRTEAMTVIDVNTGKFTGSGGTLEETVTRNNLEAAEEIVRQLRLRDIGGIIVIDFIDMVLESNRELVMRRLLECLGRDRTRHQVAEVTSLGLVQMTRKRVGQGLVEAFSTPCEHCNGRGFIVHDHPVERTNGAGGGPSGNGARDDGGSRRRGRRTPPPAEAAPEPRPAPDGGPGGPGRAGGCQGHPGDHRRRGGQRPQRACRGRRTRRRAGAGHAAEPRRRRRGGSGAGRGAGPRLRRRRRAGAGDAAGPRAGRGRAARAGRWAARGGRGRATGGRTAGRDAGSHGGSPGCRAGPPPAAEPPGDVHRRGDAGADLYRHGGRGGAGVAAQPGGSRGPRPSRQAPAACPGPLQTTDPARRRTPAVGPASPPPTTTFSPPFDGPERGGRSSAP